MEYAFFFFTDNIMVRGRKRRRNRTYEVEGEGEQETMKEAVGRPKRRRTSTFDILKSDDQTSSICDHPLKVNDNDASIESNVEETIQRPKRRRTSTFDVVKDDGLLAAETDHQTSIIQSTREDDFSELQRCKSSTFDIAKDDEPTPAKSQLNIDISEVSILYQYYHDTVRENIAMLPIHVRYHLIQEYIPQLWM